jgi:MSHA biogenesis protein MshL
VIGGLMTDKSVDNRGKVTGVGNIPVIGALFRNGAQSSSKRELVIMLKPTVVKGNEAWTDDLAKVQQRIENLGVSPEPVGDQ